MNRKSFLRGLLGSLTAVVFWDRARTSTQDRDEQGFLVRDGKDRFKRENSFHCKVSANDTDGALYAVEQRRTSIQVGTHVHPEQDEWWYIISGKWEITVGDHTHTVGTGDSVFGPRAVPHSFKKLGTDEGTMLIVFQPAGKMEAFLAKIESGAYGRMTNAQRAAFDKEHGIQNL